MDCRTSTPKDGEVILSIFKHPRPTQKSVHPKFLIPWQPVIDDEVVVVKGSWLGATGVVKVDDHPRYVVTLELDNDLWDCQFEKSDLAVIEALND